MSIKYILVFVLVSLISFAIISNLNKQLSELNIKQPVAGVKDDPYAAARFRYEMIQGKAEKIDPLSRQKAIQYTNEKLINKSLKKVNSISTWSALGPGNIGGRIRSIIIRPSNSDHILIGSVSGGIWKSTDGGASWTAKNDDGDPIAIGCMVNDGDIVYAGTGEGWGNVDAVYGGGIWKSTDFGETWTLLSSTTGINVWKFKNVKQLRIDSSGFIYAVTKAYNYKDGAGGYYPDGGLYKSTDGGTSWTKINNSSTYYYNGTDVIPITSLIILFSTYGGGIFRTTDGGTKWTKITSGLPSTGFNRIALAQDPNNSNTIYAVFSSTSSSTPTYGLEGIYKSTDAGVTWSTLSTPPRLTSTGNKSYLSAQGWYDNVIAVDPFNSSNIYVGGVETMKSTDGGSTWNQMTVWHPRYQTPPYSGTPPYAHADHHAIAFDPNNANTLYLGNDGGIFRSTDAGVNWVDLNNGLEITQYYGGAVSATGTVYMGGTQDNGHHKYVSGTTWTEVQGGDGGYAAISQVDPNIAYEEYVYLQIDKTTDGGSSWNDATTGLTDAGDGNACLFIAPFSMNPENSDVLIAGSDNVWVTTNAAANWSASSATLSTGENVSAVTIVNSNSPYLGFAGTTDGKVFKCTNITGSGDTWTDITPTGNNGAWVRRITVDQNNKNSVYVCYSGYNNDGVIPTKHIFYSNDQGANWSDQSGDLPDVPVHSLIIDPFNNQKLYIGTETGVYQSNNAGTNWFKAGIGMPDYVPVDELVLQSGTNKLLAFTHGRSVFITIDPLPVELTNFTVKEVNKKIMLNWQTATEVNNYGFEVERSSFQQVETTPVETKWETIGFVPGHGNSNSPNDYTFIDDTKPYGIVTYRLKQIDTDGSFEYSDEIKIEITTTIENKLVGNFPNPFNPTTTIRFDLAKESNVSLTIYNIMGEVVSTLIDQKMSAGKHKINFDASQLSSGIYFYQLNTGSFIDVKKMMLLR